ncbi:hypothetical protein [Capillimicrobium parvum]|uniref:DUF7847 domain-containing protein n=1 Tax=Capillimicrobium parvum TaxID=2884022 RepID=A0A9E7C2J1_9ACTN|nr:hypothetical protein [Capillimicrobium parvum]UGS37498.1 hypothetical protein DSM104329_03914 [Capillimicrobium parvum]
MTTVARKPRLHVRALFAEMLRIYRRHWRWLMLAAALVFLPLALVDGLVEEIRSGSDVAKGGLALLTTVEHMLGDVLFNGLVAAAVIAWRQGGPRLGIFAVARTLPWPTILALEVAIPVVTAVGLLLLVIPGIAFATYVTLAPAVVKVEHLRAWPSVKRSFALVRGNFWRVLLVLVLLVGVAAAVEELLQTVTPEYIGDVLVKLAVELAFSPLSAVAVVLMVFHLRRDPADGE